jgi:serine/threonine-protein kinase RsbW
MASATTIKLVLSNEVRLVDAVHAAAETMAGIAGFEEDDALNVGIAVREAVINAIVHGNRMDPSRKVEVGLFARPRGIRARVRDQGPGFDVAATPDPTSDDNLMRTSGRGILVMRAFMDSVDFNFREGRGMEVTLKKSRTGRRKARTHAQTHDQTTSSKPAAAAAADNGGSER